MNENNKDMDMEEPSFAELFESYETRTGRDLNPGDMIEGQIISIGTKSIYVDTGTKSDGVAEKAEFLDENGQFPYAVGDVVKLYIVSLTESEIILSRAISGAGKASMLEDAAEAGTPVEGRVTESIKGGFSVDLMGKRAFCPVSQMDVRYIENPEDYVGQTHNFLITRYEEGGRNIVVSRRDLLNEQIREKIREFFENFSEGDIVQGVVTRLVPYGAFIELVPGLEGMAHISELSWARIDKPEEVVNVSDSVRVKLLKIENSKESDNPRISLSLRQVSENPWESVEESFSPGDQVTGRVIRLASFGAFVQIAPGVDGLVHLSEMSYFKRILRPEEVVQVGDTVQVAIKSIDMEARRISLSIKDASGDPWVGVTQRYAPGSIVQGQVEKKEKFGIFIRLEPGVTGLMPSSCMREAGEPLKFESLKPGDNVSVMIRQTDEDSRKITLAPPDSRESDDWKQFSTPDRKSGGFGNMGDILRQAMKK